MAEIGIKYHDKDWPHGLRCMDCHKVLAEGDLYSQRLSGFVDDAPVVDIVCLACALVNA